MDKLYELEDYINRADSIAFDGCHKIYVLMDEKQTKQMIDYDYEHIISAADSNPYDLHERVRSWYDESCGLKFIQAVTTGDEADEFYDIVSQMEDLYGNEEEDDWEDDWEDEDDF